MPEFNIMILLMQVWPWGKSVNVGAMETEFVLIKMFLCGVFIIT